MSKWEEKMLGELVLSSKGKLTKQSEFPEDGYLPLINADAINGRETIFSDTKGAVLCEEDDVLMLWDGERSGLVTVGFKGVVGSTFAKLKTLEALDSKYLFYYLNEKFLWIQNNRTGTGVPHVPKDLERILLVKYPKDKTEQRQIATILSTADAVIEKTQASIAKYKAIKQGMLQDLFTRGIDTTSGKLRPSYQDAPELYKESKLGWIPKEWREEIFGEQIELVHGHQFRNYDFTEFGVAVVKIGQVKPENVDLSNCSFVSADRMEEFRNETIRNGDVLMALTGATLGKACLVSGLSNPVLQNQRVGRFEPKIKENDIDKIFLYYTLTAGELLNQIFNKVNSGAQGNIGKADFEKALFKKPPFTEQKLIAERLNTLNQKLQTEQDFLHKQQQIKAGLMHDLLSGKKKVKVKEKLETQIVNN
jgi:type I restriction enzyme S subunit